VKNETSNGTEPCAPPIPLQSVLDALPFYMLLVDDRHHIVMANRAVGQAFGKDPDSLIGQYCPQAIHGLDHPFPGCPLEEARDGDTAVERFLWDNEHHRWFKSCVYPTSERTLDGHRVFAHRVEDVTDLRTSVETLERNANTAAALNELLRLANTEAPLPALLLQMLERVLSLSWLAIERKGAVFLAGEEPGTLTMKAQSGLAPALLAGCRQVRHGCCMCGRAAETRHIQFSDRLDDRHEVRYEGIMPHGHYCLPILRGEHLLGVLNIYLSEGHSRDPHEEGFLAAVADVLATLITKRRVDDELQATLVRLRRTLGGVIDVLVSTVESRDPYTAGHQRRVSDLSRAIATEMGLPRDTIEGVRVAGAVHDIGKISVPAEILSKPGRLTAIEFQLIQAHVTIGYDILKPIRFSWPVAESVLQHHERFDGSGYPAGLAGSSIRVEARILAVADVVEAMASHRPYRPALGIEKALEEIHRGRGMQYDPDVVDACARLFEVRGYRLSK